MFGPCSSRPHWSRATRWGYALCGIVCTLTARESAGRWRGGEAWTKPAVHGACAPPAGVLPAETMLDDGKTVAPKWPCNKDQSPRSCWDQSSIRHDGMRHSAGPEDAAITAARPHSPAEMWPHGLA